MQIGHSWVKIIILKSMLVVQTSHPKELCQLEEEFDRKGDFFSVPLENSNKVYTLIEGMIFEVLGTLD